LLSTRASQPGGSGGNAAVGVVEVGAGTVPFARGVLVPLAVLAGRGDGCAAPALQVGEMHW